MASTSSKVSKSNRAVRAIIAATFPQYKGRLVTVVLTDGMPSSRQLGWDEGSKTDVRIYNTRTGGVVYAHQDGDVLAYNETSVIVEHSIFCGKDRGVTIRVRRPIADDATMSVIVDSLLERGMTDTWDLVIDATPGMEWGSYDKVCQRATVRDLLLAYLDGHVKTLAKGEKQATAS